MLYIKKRKKRRALGEEGELWRDKIHDCPSMMLWRGRRAFEMQESFGEAKYMIALQ